MTSRATSEGMKHEKFMYLAKAGAYATATDPLALLANASNHRLAGKQQVGLNPAAAKSRKTSDNKSNA